MHIKILGTGCKKCNTLTDRVKQAVEEAGIDATIEKVEDFKQIMAYGVMQTPAIVIDEQVKSYGKVHSVDELKAMLA